MQDLSDLILDAMRRGAPAEALAAAQAAVAERPDDAAALRALAFAQQATGDTGQALASLDRAIALEPDEADAHFARAGLLLGAGQVDAARESLSHSIVLDPNLFGAYLLQAQLALGRGEVDEADRLRRLAMRIVPSHPHLSAIEGTVALRRGDAVAAQRILVNAMQAAPDDPHLGYALAFTYIAQGHLAFAEQALRKVRENVPAAKNLHALIADLMHQQGRPADAAAEIAPLLADPAHATPGLHRIAGELELEAGHPERALPHLRTALAAKPGDRAILSAILQAWQRLDAADDARSTLDAALATTSNSDDLWQARLALEPVGAAAAQAVVARWRAAMPTSVMALETHMAIQNMTGDHDGADATAEQILALEPGRRSAETRLLDRLMERDPPAAVERCRQLLERTQPGPARRLVRSWLAMAQDHAGQAAGAVSTWKALQAEIAAERLPLWTPSAARSDWPELAPIAPGVVRTAFLFGAPGSAVERVAMLLGAHLPAFRRDRFGPQPPRDGFQKFSTITAVADGDSEEAATLVSGWRAGLPQRGITEGPVIDWLPFWDNALLNVLRPQLPEATLLMVVRDPRDMLLDWLAFGGPTPVALADPVSGAQWLATVLNQLAALHEQDLYPHQWLRLDDAVDDPAALVGLVGGTLGLDLPVPPAGALGPRRFPAGHWRVYAQALAEPFALLTPVARRLGYDPT
jgi:tetratricopeptide (TPR) repeat protein